MADQPLALVTGAAHRLGKAFVLALARQGYAILLHYRQSEAQASTTATEIRTLGVPVFLSQADLTDPKQISNLFSIVDKVKHPLKVLVNSAAVIPVGDPRTLSLKDWDAAYPSYSVSKAGLEALTKILARSFAPSIRVNAVAPGLVLQSDLVSAEDWNRLVERLPLKRTATVEEIAAALEFLLKNEYVTGQTLVIDGGYSLLG